MRPNTHGELTTNLLPYTHPTTLVHFPHSRPVFVNSAVLRQADTLERFTFEKRQLRRKSPCNRGTTCLTPPPADSSQPHSREATASAHITYFLSPPTVDKRLTVGKVCVGAVDNACVCRDGRCRAPFFIDSREPHFEVRFAIVCVGVGPAPVAAVAVSLSFFLLLSLLSALPARCSAVLYFSHESRLTTGRRTHAHALSISG